MQPAPSSSRRPTLSAEDAQLLIESVVDYAIFLLDTDGKVETWNPGARRIKGYEAEEIIGQHFSKFFPPEDIAQGKPEEEITAAREVGRTEAEGWRIRKDGTRFWANVIMTALYDQRGKLRGFAKVTRDLTERREAEARLRQAEERYHKLIDAVSDYAIFLLDAEGHVATWNPGARRAKGYLAQEIVGRSFSAFYTEEDRAAGRPAQILEIVRAQGRFEEEGWRVRKDGSRFWAHVVISALKDDSGDVVGFAKVTRDLTSQLAARAVERKLIEEKAARAEAERMELQLRRAARAAEEANRSKDEFLAMVSHELRTPLNAILGWAELLLNQGVADPEMQRPLQVIHRNAQAQVKIIEDIMDVARITAGKLRLDVKPLDLVTVARNALEVVRPSASSKQISLTLEAPAQVQILGDADRLQQVVWNLLSNAVKFTDIHGKIQLRIADSDGTAALSVQDDGRGIDRELLPQVFERFKQGESHGNRRVSGLGLGLALVRHIVELHGGTVRAESDGPGTGATFTVRLPLNATLTSSAAPDELS